MNIYIYRYVVHPINQNIYDEAFNLQIIGIYTMGRIKKYTSFKQY